MKRNSAFTMIELLFIVATIAILAAIAVPNFLEAQVRSKVSRTTQDMAALRAAVQAYYADHEAYPPNRAAVRDFMKWAAEPDNLAPWIDTRESPRPGSPGDMGFFDEEMMFGGFTQTTDEQLEPEEIADETEGRTLDGVQRDVIARGVADRTDLFGGDALVPILATSGYDLRAVTTPIAYYGGSLRVDTFADTRETPLPYVNLHDIVSFAPPHAAKFMEDTRYYLLSYGPDADQGTLSRRAPTDAGVFGDIVNPISGPFVEYDPTNGTVSQGDILFWGGLRPAAELPLEPVAEPAGS